jgi:hypothetical protein
MKDFKGVGISGFEIKFVSKCDSEIKVSWKLKFWKKDGFNSLFDSPYPSNKFWKKSGNYGALITMSYMAYN